jgi:hypothetical protein
MYADTYSSEANVNYLGNDIYNGLYWPAGSADECASRCGATPNCKHFVFSDTAPANTIARGGCWLKTQLSQATQVTRNFFIAGTMIPGESL